MGDPKISVVMTYHERGEQLSATLRSFRYHAYAEDIEVIIVDDGSTEGKAENCIQGFDFPIRLVYMDPREKWYSNPCIPFNVGIKQAKGEIVVIQNAECLHFSDILADVRDRLVKGTYRVYSCFSLGKSETEKLWSGDRLSEILSSGYDFGLGGGRTDGEEGWYNHSVYRPMPFHFCAAIFRDDLARIGGFDERYAQGIGFDDYEFLHHIRKAGLQVVCVDEKVVIHQWHYGNRSWDKQKKYLAFRNNQLFRTVPVAGMPYSAFQFFMNVSRISRTEKPVFRLLNRIMKLAGAEQAEYFQ
jgi:GT2 family glycosyltransferase